jgi:hypothetical protein
MGHSFDAPRPNVLRFSGGAFEIGKAVEPKLRFKKALISRAQSAVRCKRLLGHPLRCQISFRTPVGMARCRSG